MLHKLDSLYGHVIEQTDAGVVYQDDGTLVTPGTTRPCKGCNLAITRGTHDPCIANLSGVVQACCGHGLDRTPQHNSPNGYFALLDGRTVYFSGLVGAAKIREAVDALLKDEPLPEAFEAGPRTWWEGLTEQQMHWVQGQMPALLLELVQMVGEPSPAYLRNEEPWWDGLSQEQKDEVRALLGPNLNKLAKQSLIEVPV